MRTGSLDSDTPPIPPTSEEDDLSFLCLIRSRRVGPATFHRLLAQHGSIAAALDALPGIAAAAGLTGYAPCPPAQATAELRAGRRAGARLIRCDDPAYPALLRGIDDAPPVLWLRGDPAALARPALALIGARNASSLGLRMARGMARALGEAGQIVVAGLARGIDTAAHEAACPTGTIAVMAGGIDVIYPAENAALADRIGESGALLSEQPPGVAPVARHFPLRNRIISGLSRAVVVVEAAQKSGSLITARQALDQGREVMAVPGHPMDARASGCNALIRDGAILVRNAEDVLAALLESGYELPSFAKSEGSSGKKAVARGARSALNSGVDAEVRAQEESGSQANTSSAPAKGTAPDAAAGLEQRILTLLGPSPTDENMLIRDLGVTAAAMGAAVLNLELAGRVARLPGGRVALA
ncbi:DNA-processing protein DprA [uncultured Paracoccus sp.]|uniref:DNA-processing protein DprA n=1 Tax=uncultured Paracoccus sp. TaxID=189685 RepID=UPI00262B0BA7|nr:DNA-processing protein DprA [uncultured Paracoccus sp.]